MKKITDKEIQKMLKEQDRLCRLLSTTVSQMHYSMLVKKINKLCEQTPAKLGESLVD